MIRNRKMLNIILIIFKILGAVLLSLLALFLVILLLILIVPVRYVIKSEKNGELFFVNLNISWLLHVINFNLQYKEKLTYALRLIGIKIYPKKSKNKDKKSKNKPEKAKRSSRRAEKKKKREASKTDSKAEDVSLEEIKSGSVYKLEGFSEDEKSDFSENNDVRPDEEDIEKKFNKDTDKDLDIELEKEIEEELKAEEAVFEKLIEKIKYFADKIYKLFRDIKNKIIRLIDSLINKKIKLENYIDILSDERCKEAIQLCIEDINIILKNAKPKKTDIYLHFGFEDPATTGEVIAFLAMIYPFFAKSLRVDPEFNKVLFDEKIYIRGRITIIVLLTVAWEIVFNKNVRYLRHRLDKVKSTGGTK